MEEQDPWHLTVVLLEGLRLMRPEKAWRPIITLEVDKHHTHETTLGVDGQNINQKEVFKFHDVDHNTNIEIKVWHRSQSKKKKRKILVASACHCLGELVKKRSPESKLEVRLQCRQAQHKSVSSRGRPQKGAALHLKLRPPSTFNCEKQQECYESSSSSDSYPDSDSDDGSSVATAEDDMPIHRHLRPEDQPQTLRRRKVRGYVINSDDGYSTEGSFIAPPPRRRLLSDDVTIAEMTRKYHHTGRTNIDLLSTAIHKIPSLSLAWLRACSPRICRYLCIQRSSSCRRITAILPAESACWSLSRCTARCAPRGRMPSLSRSSGGCSQNGHLSVVCWSLLLP
ncbi:unnamed protein product [Cyclocybe aegerita]|uniref:C2 domain-containing protein n=1 Tax=Cyclocybe aegerita TaxID=1973307 RepID=A0A8S0XTN7_CYCAE|nr:unnamed protein product [Cyclocybe aegerita]